MLSWEGGGGSGDEGVRELKTKLGTASGVVLERASCSMKSEFLLPLSCVASPTLLCGKPHSLSRACAVGSGSCARRSVAQGVCALGSRRARDQPV